MGPVISELQKSTEKTHRLLSQIFCSLFLQLARTTTVIIKTPALPDIY